MGHFFYALEIYSLWFKSEYPQKESWTVHWDKAKLPLMYTSHKLYWENITPITCLSSTKLICTFHLSRTYMVTGRGAEQVSLRCTSVHRHTTHMHTRSSRNFIHRIAPQFLTLEVIFSYFIQSFYNVCYWSLSLYLRTIKWEGG